jgi:hypothetical protein
MVGVQALLFAVLLGAYDRALQKGDSNKVEQLRSRVIKETKSLGMDIQNLQL